MLNKCSRSDRMKAARLKGRHSKEQWERLKKEFNHLCVRCGFGKMSLDKDHIIPVYQGGSDAIENIQPMCAWCNASKGAENFNWKDFRRNEGWVKVAVNLARTHPYRDILE